VLLLFVSARKLMKNFMLPRHSTMDRLIPKLEEHFSLRLVVEFPELDEKVTPDPYTIHRTQEVAARIGMENGNTREF